MVVKGEEEDDYKNILAELSICPPNVLHMSSTLSDVMTLLLFRERRKTCLGSWRTFWQSSRGRRDLYPGMALRF